MAIQEVGGTENNSTTKGSALKPATISDDSSNNKSRLDTASVIVGSNGVAATVDSDGHLHVGNIHDGLSIAQGLITGTAFIHKFGSAPDFDFGDGVVDIWDGADDGNLNQMNYVYSTSADIDSLVSSDDTDAQDVEVQGLDSNFDLVIQTITLSGQTRVALTTALIRVFRLKNVGTTNNAGQVCCYVDSAITNGIPDDSSKVRACIGVGNNQTLMAVYTVPAGKTGYMRSFFAGSGGANKSINYVIDLFARPTGEVFQLKHRSSIADGGSSHWNHVYEEPEVLAAKTDVVMRVKAASAVTGANVSAGFDIVLVDD